MGDMMSDINKYAKIWDKAQEQGIFADAEKPPEPRLSEPEGFGSDFFGQNLMPSDDVEVFLSESDIEYWAKVANISGSHNTLTEANNPTEKKIKKVTKKVANDPNPQFAQSLGSDSNSPDQYDARYADKLNWSLGGEKYKQLTDLKLRLHDVEVKFAKMLGTPSEKAKDINSQDDELKKISKQIKKLKQEIDNISNSTTGSRYSYDG